MKKTTIIYCLGAVLFCIAVIGTAVISASCGKKNEQSGSVTEFSGSFVEKGRPVADLASYRIAYYEPL